MPSNIPVDEDDVREVKLLLRSHHPLLFIAESETARVRSLLEQVSLSADLPLLVWRAHRGLTRVGGDGSAIYKTEPPAQCLAHLVSANAETVAFLQDFERHLEDGEVQARLFELHESFLSHRGAVVLNGNIEDLPPKLSRYFTVVRLRTPSLEAYHSYVSAVLADVRRRQPVAVHLSPEDVAEMLEHLRGLPFHEVRKVVTQALVEDGRLDRSDILSILDAKKRVVERVGVLEYIPVDPGGATLAGLNRLKRWLDKRRLAFTEPAKAKKAGLPAPRGLLLTGVQGCGKSLSAKALSASFRLPLVRLDPGSLYRKYFGESEQNLRRALQTAESVAPCILWIDEIEKAFGGRGDSDGGTSRRIFGTFLTWMQEKKETVFVFATANDISELPPELLRKGRFDEIFFVDLPSAQVRGHIFALHLARRQKDPSLFDLDTLSGASDGFSGAEIEQVVVSGLYTALAEDLPLSTEILLRELAETQPLSVTMREKVAALRAWAAERAVPVD